MAIVALVRRVNQRLQLGHVVRIGKVDYVNGDIVLSESFAESLKVRLVLLKRVPAENDNSWLRILVHPVLQRQLGDLHSRHEISLPV